jgi:hypothetical protein
MSKELTTALFDATQRVMAKERMDLVNQLAMREYESEQNRFSMELRIQITELQYKLAQLDSDILSIARQRARFFHSN